MSFWTFAARIAEARRNARLSRREIEALKLQKFRRLVRHAQANSAYYAGVIAERGIDVATCSPADFPVLTKATLMAEYDRIVTDPRITRQGVADFLTRSQDPADLYLNEFRVMHTSGTSGEVGYFVFSPDDWARGLAAGGQRRRSRLGPRRGPRGKVRVAFYGATGGHYAGVTLATGAGRGLGRLFVKVGVFEINRPLEETVADLNAFQPDILSGYTAALRMLADRQRQGGLHIAPMLVSATGETATGADLKDLAEAFAARAGSIYACTEHFIMGASNPDGETMTLHDDELIFELHSDHTLVTNLFNYTLPLIRYRMSDILHPVEQAVDEPRHIVIKSLVGRSERVPIFVNLRGEKDFISPHTINEVFVAGVARFQMRLTGEASFRFLVCLDPRLEPAERAVAVAGVEARLREILEQKDMTNVSFAVEAVEALSVNARTRKFQLIVDERA